MSMPKPMAMPSVMAWIQISRSPTVRSLPLCPFRRKGSPIPGERCLTGCSPETPGAPTIISSGEAIDGRIAAGADSRAE